MVEINLNSVFIHEFVIHKDILIVMSNFKDSVQVEEGERHGLITIENNHPVIDWSNFPVEELNSFHGKVEIR